jgi:hypothetical protein
MAPVPHCCPKPLPGGPHQAEPLGSLACPTPTAHWLSTAAPEVCLPRHVVCCATAAPGREGLCTTARSHATTGGTPAHTPGQAEHPTHRGTGSTLCCATLLLCALPGGCLGFPGCCQCVAVVHPRLGTAMPQLPATPGTHGWLYPPLVRRASACMPAQQRLHAHSLTMAPPASPPASPSPAHRGARRSRLAAWRCPLANLTASF